VIKAVFFDWFNTLAHFDPPRHELYIQVFRQFGIELPAKEVIRGIFTADQYFFAENAKSRVKERSREERIEVFVRYPEAILAEAGVEAPKELLLKVVDTVAQQFKGATFTLFDDALPTLKTLKERKFILGLLTNLNKDMNSLCRELGLEPYLDFVVTPGQVGADKPEPSIFLAALQRAEVNASEAVHVGDQYNLDVLGARRVGITPVLIDRYDLYPEVSDCHRIHRLTELAEYL